MAEMRIRDPVLTRDTETTGKPYRNQTRKKFEGISDLRTTNIDGQKSVSLHKPRGSLHPRGPWVETKKVDLKCLHSPKGKPTKTTGLRNKKMSEIKAEPPNLENTLLEIQLASTGSTSEERSPGRRQPRR